MAYKLTDFSDLYAAIQEELKVQSTDTNSLNRIKRAINMMYLDEVVPAARWPWLNGNTTIVHPAFYGTGTASVTPLSDTVTLSIAVPSTVGASGSFLNYLFSVDGTNEVYKVAAHTALSTTVTLDKAYNGVLSATASYKIWKEDLELPTDLRETIEVWHDHMTDPMEPRGLQEFRRTAAEGQKSEARPCYYTTYDYRDPSTDDGETESDRYRLLKVFPSISSSSTLIKLDYVKEVSALDAAGDEPAMAVEDRIVLFYGALSLLWGSIGRNPEEAARNRGLFDTKLAKMAGKIQDSMDKPQIAPDSTYMLKMRGNRIKGISRRGNSAFGGGQSTYSAPTYLAGVTINGATITGNVTVSPGITVDGIDLSADAATQAAHIALTSGVHGAVGSVVGTTDTQTLTNKTVDASANTITNLTNTSIAAAADIARTKIAAGTAYAILANNAAGVMSENAALIANTIVASDVNGQLVSSAITATELTYLDDAEAVTSISLNDNTASPTVVASWAASSFAAIHMNYILRRGASNYETGTIMIITNAASAAMAQNSATLGALGVSFTVDYSTPNVRLLYTTTSTGLAATGSYKLQKWA